MTTDLTVGLPIDLYGTRIGELVRAGGKAMMRWSDEAEERWGLNSTALSANLRTGFTSPDESESFFGALLPEAQWLNVLARDLSVESDDLVGILEQVGGDLAGALTIGKRRDRGEAEKLNDAEVSELVDNAKGFLVGGGGSALSGFQRKLTLTRHDGAWWRGGNALPSTHILKPVAEQDRESVERENYALALARHVGLTTFGSAVEQIGNRWVLVVERYDRIAGSDGIAQRLHQEDMAQALGLPWGGNEKFGWHDARANLAAIAATLDVGRAIFARGESDRERLLRYTVFNVAVGNTDAHAKNFSIIRPETGRGRLAPLYDVAPLILNYDAPLGLAMSIGGAKYLPDVTRENLVDEAMSWGIPAPRATQIVDATLEALIEATQDVEPHPMVEALVPGYVRGQAKNLLAGRRAQLDIRGSLAVQTRIDSEHPPRTESRE